MQTITENENFVQVLGQGFQVESSESIDYSIDTLDLGKSENKTEPEENKQTVTEHIFDTFNRKIKRKIQQVGLKDYLFDGTLFEDVPLPEGFDIENAHAETEEDVEALQIDIFIRKMWSLGQKQYKLYPHINERKFFVMWATAVCEAHMIYDADEPELSNYRLIFNRSMRPLLEKLDSRYWQSGRLSGMEIFLKECEQIATEISLNESIPFCEENKDRLIKQNLKAVIGMAKRYQGLGVEMEDLIGAGNLGLCMAWTKFKPERAKTRENTLDAIAKMHRREKKDVYTKEEVMAVFMEVLTYGKLIAFLDEKLPAEITYEALVKFVEKYIQSAKFSSVANSWIRAHILSELDANSRTVRKQKSDIYKDKEKYGAFVKEVKYDINAPLSGEQGRGTSTGLTLGDILGQYVLTPAVEEEEDMQMFKRSLTRMMGGLKARDKRIVFKKFGVGMPREMTPREIAETEGISIARVSQILQSAFDHIQRNVSLAGEMGEDFNIEELFYIAKNVK